jgi:MoaA/NifB/PqqE/SkfB family radical SAM enzyme
MENRFTLAIEVNNSCNFNCPYCLNRSESTEELTVEQWAQVFEKVDFLNPDLLVISGGEPTIRYDLKDIIKPVRERNIRVSLITNGAYLDDFHPSDFDSIQLTYHPWFSNLKEFKRLMEKYRPQINMVHTKMLIDNMCYVNEVLELSKILGLPVMILAEKGLKPDFTCRQTFEFAKGLKMAGYNIVVDEFMWRREQRCKGGGGIALDSKGNIMSCLFVREKYGNILNINFKEFWQNWKRIPCPYSFNPPVPLNEVKRIFPYAEFFHTKMC